MRYKYKFYERCMLEYVCCMVGPNKLLFTFFYCCCCFAVAVAVAVTVAAAAVAIAVACFQMTYNPCYSTTPRRRICGGKSLVPVSLSL